MQPVLQEVQHCYRETPSQKHHLTRLEDCMPRNGLFGNSLYDPDYNIYSSGHPSLALDHSVFDQQKRVVMLPVTERT